MTEKTSVETTFEKGLFASRWLMSRLPRLRAETGLDISVEAADLPADLHASNIDIHPIRYGQVLCNSQSSRLAKSIEHEDIFSSARHAGLSSAHVQRDFRQICGQWQCPPGQLECTTFRQHARATDGPDRGSDGLIIY